MNIGVLCPSEIALRRFMPALKEIDALDFVGIGVSTKEERFNKNLPIEKNWKEIIERDRKKANFFIEQYGGKIFNGYAEIIMSKEIDAIYIPLPPALHFQWSKLALEHGKHVLVEKPSTIFIADTQKLIDIASKSELALHENYMFVFHKQLEDISTIIKSGEIGDVRLYRISFGFPRRAVNDFRYNKALGGGALIDAGGYTIKYAAMLLGKTAKIQYAQMNYIDEFDVDIFGSAALVNDRGVTAQIAFGMDNSYKCELEIWGSKGCLRTNRVLTAPVGFIPEATIYADENNKTYQLSQDDAFKKSIIKFLECTHNHCARKNNYDSIMKQAELVDEFYRLATKHGNNYE
ncbi:Gfo/Idh/MocA family protein [Eubacterium limosum]|uniref:Gfo/Idh/MocA family oxidoreductase n=1 Tax=Eubacterium limosum TaxID=1736 RepID=A0ABT5UM90_EUBLI|nr:Gfo/Idh/MocA family oxidoreductase [Eubacterium limosum]MCB6568174.1 Gfo/Idh/MocA family oxidoreductase [Eubacterium limosum]MDE1470039.1 Gfo/Idh/MocA family oxidoreductase [Eubacterium limosum]